MSSNPGTEAKRSSTVAEPGTYPVVAEADPAFPAIVPPVPRMAMVGRSFFIFISGKKDAAEAASLINEMNYF